ncbi:hypothetical protein FKM82_024691 [Ascaphus truei]
MAVMSKPGKRNLQTRSSLPHTPRTLLPAHLSDTPVHTMESSSYPRQLHSPVAGAPPFYGNQGYEPLREELMEFRGVSGEQPQSTVLIMANDPPVRDHIVWSLFNTIFLNFCCLGFFALVFSVKSRDRKLIRDVSGATSYGSTAALSTLLPPC